MTMRADNDFVDPRFNAAWRRVSREEPPAALDDAIRAAARREVGARPQDVAQVPLAKRPQRWWFPLAAAATIGAIAIGLLQLSTPERIAPLDEPRVVSDIPAGAKEIAPASPQVVAPPSPPVDVAPAPAAKSEAPKTPAAARDVARRQAPRANEASSARAEPKPFPAEKPDAREQAAQPPKVEAVAPPPLPAQPTVDEQRERRAVAPEPTFAQQSADERRARQAAEEPSITLKSRLAREPLAGQAATPGRSAPAASAAPAAEGAIAATAPSAPVAAAPPPMAAPTRAGAKVAADRADSIDALAKSRATMSAPDWIALMRRLRDERRYDELSREIAAFRSLYGIDALPPDLRDVAPAAR
jgi:hypothetical protein